MSSKADLRIMKINEDSSVDFGLNNLTSLVTGTEKLAQMFIKMLYGEDVGTLFRDLKESNDDKETVITNSIARVVTAIIDLQSDRDIPDDEKLVSASLTNLTINSLTNINISIKLTTAKGFMEIEV